MKKGSACRVLENERIKENFYLLRLHAPWVADCCVPGQFVMVRSEAAGWPYLNRPFSIYDSDRDSVVELLYKVVGSATALMARMGKGDSLELIGPLGRGFSPADSVSHLVAVAGGIGLPPLAFYCRTYSGSCDAVTLVIGAAGADELLFPVGMMAEGIKVVTYTEDGSKGSRGLATDGLARLLPSLAAAPQAARIAACGPRKMLGEVSAIAESGGITCEASVEEMMACGVGACMSCAIPARGGGYLHACKDGPVIDTSLIDFERWLKT